MDPRHIPIRSYTVFQTSEGWFWNWPLLECPVGPFQTLPEVLTDLQHVMGVIPSIRELTSEEEKIVQQALIDSGQTIFHDPKTGPCPACGFQVKQMGRAKPMVIEED